MDAGISRWFGRVSVTGDCNTGGAGGVAHHGFKNPYLSEMQTLIGRLRSPSETGREIAVAQATGCGPGVGEMGLVLGCQKSMPREGEMLPNWETVESKYANYFRVGHNAFEFIVEFAQLYSDPPVEKVHTRIVTSPAYAKELLGVLQQAMDEYEGAFGAIPPASSR